MWSTSGYGRSVRPPKATAWVRAGLRRPGLRSLESTRCRSRTRLSMTILQCHNSFIRIQIEWTTNSMHHHLSSTGRKGFHLKVSFHAEINPSGTMRKYVVATSIIIWSIWSTEISLAAARMMIRSNDASSHEKFHPILWTYHVVSSQEYLTSDAMHSGAWGNKISSILNHGFSLLDPLKVPRVFFSKLFFCQVVRVSLLR